MRELRKTAIYRAYAAKWVGLGTPPAPESLEVFRTSLTFVFFYLYNKDLLHPLLDKTQGQLSAVALDETKRLVDTFRLKLIPTPDYLFQFWDTDGSH